MVNSRALQFEDPRDELAPGAPFVTMFIGDRGDELKLIPDFLIEFSEQRYSGTDGQHESIAFGQFRIFDPSFDFVERLLVAGGTSRGADPRRVAGKQKIRYEFGWAGADIGSRLRATPRDTILSALNPNFSFQGNTLNFETVDAGQFTNKGVWTRFFYEDEEGNVTLVPKFGASLPVQAGQPPLFPDPGLATATVSGVVNFLAEEMGLQADVEPTEGRFNLHQLNETNFSFIKRILLPLAVNVAGIPNFEFRIVNRTLVFRRPNYEIRRRYWFARDIVGTMLTFQPKIVQNALLSETFADVVSVGFSPLDKTQLITEIDVADEEKQEVSYVPLAKNTFKSYRPKKSTAGRLYVTPYAGADQIIQWNRTKFHDDWWKSVTMTAVIMGDPDLGVSDVIDVILLTPQGDVHYTSGTYLLKKVNHRIRPGSFVTEVEGVREGHDLAGAESLSEIRKEFSEFFRSKQEEARTKKSTLTEAELNTLFSTSSFFGPSGFFAGGGGN